MDDERQFIHGICGRKSKSGANPPTRVEIMEIEEDVASKVEKGTAAAAVTPFSINDILNSPKSRDSDMQERALDMSKSKWNGNRGKCKCNVISQISAYACNVLIREGRAGNCYRHIY